MKRFIYLSAALILLIGFGLVLAESIKGAAYKEEYMELMELRTDSSPIKWVEFKASASLIKHAIDIDKESFGTENPIDFIDLLAYTAAICGGEFDNSSPDRMDKFAKRLSQGEDLFKLTDGMRYFKYYRSVYNAIFSEYVKLTETVLNGGTDSSLVKSGYGLAVFSPIAKGYDYLHYKDFHNERNYGYKRLHMGNDLMGEEGTPIIAIEGGVVEALGWNEYGGWRIGIRSFDRLRYYYYAHLRKNHPYVASLKEGDVVSAGDCIGYLGKTGGSKKEGTENLKRPHLHIGLQLIFDESQKDGQNQIWIDMYEIIELLDANRCEVEYDAQSNEFFSKYNVLEVGDI